MANRFPLIVDSSLQTIRELPSGDNLDLANNSIVNVVDITASGDVSIGGNTAITGDMTVANITATGDISVAGITSSANLSVVGLTTSSDLTVGGNLTVNGTTTTLNSTTLTIDDKNIVLASGAADGAAADGAGITIDGASATITYDGTNDRFAFNKRIDTSGIILSDAAVIGADTADGADTKQFYFAGGGSASWNRGSYIKVAGNEATGAGILSLVAGNQAGATIDFYTAAGIVGQFGDEGDFHLYDNAPTPNIAATWDASTQRLGIGTQSPTSELEIYRETTVSGPENQNILNLTAVDTDGGYFYPGLGAGLAFRVGKTSTTAFDPTVMGAIYGANASAESVDNGYMTFHTRLNGTLAEKVRITKDGQVGIGTDAPDAPLHVVRDPVTNESGIINLLTLEAKDTDNNDDYEVGDGVGILFKIGTNDVGLPAEQSQVGAQIAAVRDSASDTNSSTRLEFYTTEDNETLNLALKIRDNGKIGINTRNTASVGLEPPTWLTIVGDDGEPSTTGDTAVTGAVQIQNVTNDVVLEMGINSPSGNRYAWHQVTNKQNHQAYYDMSIQPLGGNLGIGEKTPDAKLHITSSGTMGGGATLANAFVKISDASSSLYFDTNEMFTDTTNLHIGAKNAGACNVYLQAGAGAENIFSVNSAGTATFYGGIKENAVANDATPDLDTGTVFTYTSSTTITMPSAESGRSFTVIASTPPSWSGNILWSGGNVPTGTGRVIYTFISDGTHWYGMEAGANFS